MSSERINTAPVQEQSKAEGPQGLESASMSKSVGSGAMGGAAQLKEASGLAGIMPLQLKTSDAGGCGCPSCSGGAAQRKSAPTVAPTLGGAKETPVAETLEAPVQQKSESHGGGCNCPACGGTVQKKAMGNVPAMQLKAAGTPVVQRAEGDVSYYYATAASNIMRVKTDDNRFQPMFKGAVKKGGATKLDASAAFAPKTDEGSTIAAASSGTWYIHPDNTKYALFTSGGTSEWVEASKLSGTQISIPINDRVTLSGAYDAPTTGADGNIVLEVTWGGYTGWTAKANLSPKIFNTKYATPTGAAAGTRDLEYNQGAYPEEQKTERQASRDFFVKNSPNAVIAKSTAQDINKLPKVNNGSALIKVWNETTKSFDNGAGKLSSGQPVVLKEEMLVSETKAGKTKSVWYAKVITTDGSEVWTWAGDEPRKANSKGNLTMTSFSAAGLDSYTNTTFRAALAQAYSTTVLDFLASKSGFTADQQSLFQEAAAFIADTKAQAAISSSVVIDSDNMTKEGNTLNADLVSRLKLFHKFMVSKDLVRGTTATVSDGVRSASDAHRWSTAYNIRQGNVPYESIKALAGGKDVDNNLWYVPATDDVYKDVPLEGKELEDEKAKKVKDPAYVPKTTKNVFDQALTYANLKKRALGHWKGAEAAEGYPASSASRLPNISSVNISNHVSGNAVDITIPFKVNYYDPLIDGLGLMFGLFRAVKDAASAEHWHYERVGVVVPGTATSTAEHQSKGG